MSLKEGYKKTSKIVFKAPVREKKSVVVNGIDLLENVPPRTENEVGQRCPGARGREGTMAGKPPLCGAPLVLPNRSARARCFPLP